MSMVWMVEDTGWEHWEVSEPLTPTATHGLDSELPPRSPSDSLGYVAVKGGKAALAQLSEIVQPKRNSHNINPEF